MAYEPDLRKEMRLLSARHRSSLYRAFQRWKKSSPLSKTMTAAELNNQRLKLKAETMVRLQEEKIILFQA